MNELEDFGYCILRGQLNTLWIDELCALANDALKLHKIIQTENNSEIKTNGVALHALINTPELINLLIKVDALGILNNIQENYFHSPFIVNSFSVLNNEPNEQNFSAIIHRDIRFFSGELPLMLNMLVMLDDFTEDNGATYLFPGSHKVESPPTEECFKKHAIQAIGKAGDILIFNSNLYHCAGLNKTDKRRRAIPITFTKSSMKQLLDYPRAIGYENMNKYTERIQQLLGYYSRVPASLEEWYLPHNERYYRKNQD